MIHLNQNRLIRVLGVAALSLIAACQPLPPGGPGSPGGSGAANRPAVMGTLDRTGPDVRVDRRAATPGMTVHNGAYVETGAASQARINFTDNSFLMLDERTDPAFWLEWVSATRCVIRYVVSSGSIGGDTGACDHAVTDADGNEWIVGSEYVVTHAGRTTVFTLLSGHARMQRPRRIKMPPGSQITVSRGIVSPLQRLTGGQVRELRNWLRGFDFSRARPRIRLVTVPRVRGRSARQAEQALAEVRLALGAVETAPAQGRKPGTIIEQRPSGGVRVPPGTLLNVVVAAEGQTAPPVQQGFVPALRGLTVAAARQTLQERGFALGRVDHKLSASARAGTVLEQSIQPNSRRAAGTRVDITIAEAGVKVPKLGGISVKEAAEKLRRAGLEIGRVEPRPTNTARPGTVLDQKPKAGALLRRGSRVSVVAAQQQAATSCRVPKIRKLTFARAKVLLREAGLKWRVVARYPYGQDRVSGVKPAEGTQIPCSRVIEIQLGVIG